MTRHRICLVSLPVKKVDTSSTKDKTRSTNRLRETEAGFLLPARQRRKRPAARTFSVAPIGTLLYCLQSDHKFSLSAATMLKIKVSDVTVKSNTHLLFPIDVQTTDIENSDALNERLTEAVATLQT